MPPVGQIGVQKIRGQLTQSSRKPGVLESGGVGAATAVASTAGAMPPALSAEVDALAAKMAEEIAKKLHVLFKQQGWVAR